MSDTYEDDNDPIQTIPPTPSWLEGEHLITVEPLTRSYSVCTVSAQRGITSVGTVILCARPVLILSNGQCWEPDPAALERAVRRAIAECEKGGRR